MEFTTVLNGSATISQSSGSSLVAQSSGGSFVGGSLPPTTFDYSGGYWLNGWWYPGVPYVPQPYPVPYPVVVPSPALGPTPAELALEVLRLGGKAPKVLRDRALKILGASLGGFDGQDDDDQGPV